MNMSDVFNLPIIENDFGDMIFSSKKSKLALSVAINNHDSLTETNRLLNLECEELKDDVEKLRQAFGILKTMTIQERGWRLEDSDIGNCEFKESIENLTYKIDSLLDK